ncbi:MAG: hypothetical protein AAB416_02950 [Patescibacteria group bacterium]
MNPNKTHAVSLRRQGKSYKEIVRITGVPKSTLCGWLQHQKWSVAIRKKLSKIQSENARVRMIAITDKAREQRQILYQSYREDAQTTFEGYYKEALFVAGVMLYWGEGDNKLSNGLIRISNSDPMVLKFFHAFVGRYLPELYPKLKMSLVLYPDLEDVASCEYWSEKVGIPLDRFMKSQYIQGRSKKRTLPYGTAQIYVPSTAYKHKLLEWIQLARSNIQHAGIV